MGTEKMAVEPSTGALTASRTSGKITSAGQLESPTYKQSNIRMSEDSRTYGKRRIALAYIWVAFLADLPNVGTRKGLGRECGNSEDDGELHFEWESAIGLLD